jgi:hydrogenase maturation protein HypF
MKINGYCIEITGIVQGVGFRPFVFKLAKSMNINGYVMNKGDRVEIFAECTSLQLDEFIKKINSDAPILSEISDIAVKDSTIQGYADFSIEDSSQGNRRNIFISPDISTCEDCKKELTDPSNLRYRYPFINCTNCGPRFSIIEDIPYDRKNTTMSVFKMCKECEADYRNTYDRRYHAQPTACKNCGPKLIFFDAKQEGPEDHQNTRENKSKTPNLFEEDALASACRMLLDGKIVAIKGLGGFHLACSAEDKEAVSRLRKRKKRDGKPFAIMVKDTETAKRYCIISEFEKSLMESNRSPIVLLKKRRDCDLPDDIAERSNYLGIMLPNTPLQTMIFDVLSKAVRPISALIMTSGNISDEPICFKDNEAVLRLSGIADGFLTNDREIHIRIDDSVTRAFMDKEFIIRRSRGYVPLPLTCERAIGLSVPIKIPDVLACGGEQKNTFCMNKNAEFYISHHIGDLENLETLKSFEEGIKHFSNMFNINIDILAHDLHPDYLSSKYAKNYGFGPEKLIPIQHHHAHIASCMADNNIDGDVIGVAFDGTGLGEDGKIWGGEFFVGGYNGFKRTGHLEYVGMPGGEAAIKEPWRMAESYLYHLKQNGIDPDNKKDGSEMLKNVKNIDREMILHMLSRKINTPLTSSMGRLFDAVAGLIGFVGEITYEGQAAIELEYMAEKDTETSYNFELKDLDGEFNICVNETIKGIIDDVENKVSKSVISAKFHNTVSDIICRCCLKIRKDTGLKRVALSGGVFQNIILLEKSIEKLKSEDFEVYIHSRVPTNDGCISLGQAVIALNRANG